jgi:Polyketide cyclase / dehydrase and lipid transport
MRIECAIDIARPRTEVFAFVAEPQNDRLWCPKVDSVTPADEAASGPGATYLVVHSPIPLRPAREMTYRLVDWDPPSRIDWHEDDGRDRIDVTYLLERVSDDVTRFTQVDQLRLAAPRFLHPLMRHGIRHDLRGQLRRLRAQLESKSLNR